MLLQKIMEKCPQEASFNNDSFLLFKALRNLFKSFFSCKNTCSNKNNGNKINVPLKATDTVVVVLFSSPQP